MPAIVHPARASPASCVRNCFAGLLDGHKRSGFWFQCPTELELRLFPCRFRKLGYFLVDKSGFFAALECDRCVRVGGQPVTQGWAVAISFCHTVPSVVSPWSIPAHLQPAHSGGLAPASTGEGCSLPVILRAEDMPKPVSFISLPGNSVI